MIASRKKKILVENSFTFKKCHNKVIKVCSKDYNECLIKFLLLMVLILKFDYERIKASEQCRI